MLVCFEKIPGLSAVLAAVLAVGTPALASNHPPRFTGADSCQSSGCHGGAGPEKNQNLVWKKSDFHSRAFAILATSRSARIAENLQITSATESARCTVCHSPFQAVGQERLAKTARPDEGVSCESCHGAAEPWIRSHTRLDFTHSDKIASGMRELKGAYARANACVACHEVIEPAILEAGHPRLAFELDSQLVSQPPHWKGTDSWTGPRLWLTGQAVALREQSQDNRSQPRWKALVWLLGAATQNADGLPKLPSSGITPDDSGTQRATQHWADELARAADRFQWSTPQCLKMLKALASLDVNAPTTDEQISRAQALAQALDRLALGLKKNGHPIAGADAGLDLLFADVRDPYSLNLAQFSQHLRSFKDRIPGNQPTQ